MRYIQVHSYPTAKIDHVLIDKLVVDPYRLPFQSDGNSTLTAHIIGSFLEWHMQSAQRPVSP